VIIDKGMREKMKALKSQRYEYNKELRYVKAYAR
jgi:hypothetical protein